jgi:hypothetical protein
VGAVTPGVFLVAHVWLLLVALLSPLLAAVYLAVVHHRRPG